MAVATAVAIAGLIVAAAGTAVSAMGAQTSAKAQQASLNYNASVQKNAADTAAEQGAFDAQQIRDQNRRIAATQRANAAASGIDPDSGTAADVQKDSANHGELEAMIALYTGRSGAISHLAAAGLDKSQASYAGQAGAWSTGSTILGGATQITGMLSSPNFRK